MKFTRIFSLKEISEILGCEYVGDKNFSVSGLNEIHVVTPGDIVFVDHPKYYDKALRSKASVILIDKKVDCPPEKALLISDTPFDDFNRLIQYFRSLPWQEKELNQPIQTGENTQIHSSVLIGKEVVIGSQVIIHPNVIIGDHTRIGDNVIIQSGTVIGSDGFYYKKQDDGFHRLYSAGNVVIEDDVEIGANCTIDRGVTNSTTIGQDSKIDNQVHIGHDTIIGKHCLIAAQVAIAGCVVLEDCVTLWGQVGLTSGIRIGMHTTIMAQAGVSKSLAGNKMYLGSPASEARQQMKEMATLRQLTAKRQS